MNPDFNNLPESSLDWLQDLIEINIDSSKGFGEAAEKLGEMKQKDRPVEAMFRSLSADRSAQAQELKAIVSANRAKPTDSGSVAAAAHRTWMDLRAALGGGEQALLSEAERGEDQIKAKYEEALKDLGTCPCTQVLRRHYVAVKASHDKVRDLRDAYAKV